MAYDYVLAGGGSAGSTLAARLSEDPRITVCLIEAGGEGKGILVRAPIGVAAMLSGQPKINNWAFETVPQPGLNGRRGYQPRGKALGGSSAINGMIYILAKPPIQPFSIFPSGCRYGRAHAQRTHDLLPL